MTPDVKHMTWFGKHVEFTHDEGFGPALERVPAWLKSVGALEIDDVPPTRCSSSEPITKIARFSWSDALWHRVTIYIGYEWLHVTVCCDTPYESKVHMMTRDAASYVKNDRHRLDELDQRYVVLLPCDLLERWEAEGKK